MSVVEGERSKGNLEVIEASKNLVRYTHDRVKDKEIFPKNERWMLANATYQSARGARSMILRANAIKVESKTDAETRINCEKQAIGYLEDLSDCIDTLHITEKISGDRADYWISLVEKTMKPLKGWLKSDKRRYKEFLG